jgi:transcriptional regulator with XRE-family HTH domain
MDYSLARTGGSRLEKRIGERFRDLRNYLGLTGPIMAGKLGITKSTISAIETEDRSLTRELIQKICDGYSIDARYFFGQVETPEEADLSKRGSSQGASRLESIEREIRELRTKVQPIRELDPLAERVMVNHELRELVRLIQFWEGSMIRRLHDIAYGYLAGLREEPAKKEKVS